MSEPAVANVDEEPSHEFRAIFEQYGPFVWRALRHFGVREADLADQCQEVFVVVHKRLGSFEGRSSLQTWVYGIAMRIASEYRRRAYVRREVTQDELPVQTVDANQVDSLETVRARNKLRALLDGLEQTQRDVFILYELEGLSMKQIAELMECPLQTAYSRLRLAREFITRHYADDHSEGGDS